MMIPRNEDYVACGGNMMELPRRDLLSLEIKLSGSSCLRRVGEAFSGVTCREKQSLFSK